jgi:hypothetical protein
MEPGATALSRPAVEAATSGSPEFGLYCVSVTTVSLQAPWSFGA